MQMKNKNKQNININTSKDVKELKKKTSMVLIGALLSRFKCLLTSSFCLEEPSLVESETEIKTPHKQKTKRTVTPNPKPITKTTRANTKTLFNKICSCLKLQTKKPLKKTLKVE
jgi:hypothetical protein